jgi:hypothetical protein
LPGGSACCTDYPDSSLNFNGCCESKSTISEPCLSQSELRLTCFAYMYRMAQSPEDDLISPF